MHVLFRLTGLAVFCAAAMLLLPASAFAEGADTDVAVDTVWVMLAAFMVFFMLAGLAALEIGLVRGKNAGAIVSKLIFVPAIAAIAFWTAGFAFGFGGDGDLIGSTGFFLSGFSDPLTAFPAMGFSDATIEAKWFFQYAFAAVVLGIALGPIAERAKFAVYVIFGLAFCGFIYPVAAHWVYGGGWLQQMGMEDFAGSTAVHLVGAMAGLAGVLLLGPRRGKYRGGVSRPIVGHSMPMFGLGVLFLWFGWFGFNGGSTFMAIGERFPEVVMVTHMSVASGVIAAALVNWIQVRDWSTSMLGNGAIAGAVAITAPSGYVETWAAIPIGFIGGSIVVFGLNWIDSKLDDPIGAITAHGMVGLWGTIAVGIFAAPKLAEGNAVGVKDGAEYIGGLVYSGSFEQLGVQLLGAAAVAAFVFVTSFAVFAAIKATIGLRVGEGQEDAGLDISEHGVYGYPELFIPVTEQVDPGLPGTASHASVALRT
jgi:Amt family ammonium transporter